MEFACYVAVSAVEEAADANVFSCLSSCPPAASAAIGSAKTSARGSVGFGWVVFVRKSPGRSGSTKVQIAERRDGRDVVLEHVGTARPIQEITVRIAGHDHAADSVSPDAATILHASR